ncbi:putative cobaltochelatase [Sporomusa acidovorans]|uniref:Mg-protoporphyrin IX chelatase n=1 Tax=Sporomusa acidovorans (strain ATCC 49682 / DSM 3132 / Mol) TaxID=1123286 RepID=A0ABZ3IYD0_SPOA4|nr:putative cobaltochelatase [Sporomusa acidovorans]OZC22197.1 magnesium-chelatase 38 kDa subunit [Sporomusa acidovorans DSM 3132]SDE81757.1 protoporphyrin IX magnesium-chelatase [Sporomusa acidovorans]
MERSTKQRRVLYPFAALAGQEELQLGLLLHAVNPRLGGILIRGEKGTAKSTAVRGLAEMLPDIQAVAGCPYHCDPEDKSKACADCRSDEGEWQTFAMPVPVIDIPVSATEDRVVGSLDFEQAIKAGRRAFLPGLLGEANRGIIYIDEINLLDDHIVDVLLDAAGSGLNVVEREGISITHPTEFILVGTMNPEEGDLRPQLLDRFALCVEVAGLTDREARVEIIKRREAFESDPAAFRQEWQPEQDKLRAKVVAARKLLPAVAVPDKRYEMISRLCTEAYAAGHRADIMLVRAAAALAAWRGHQAITGEDVLDIAPLVLAHRRREPPEDAETPQQQQQEQPEPPEDQSDELEQQDNPPPPPPGNQQQEEQQQDNKDDKEDNDNNQEASSSAEVVFAIGKPFAIKRITMDKDRQARRGSGRRSRTKTDSSVGRYVKSTCHRERDDLAIDATIRAAAPFQRSRKSNGMAVVIETSDIREKVREKRIGNFMLFVVDASGSMGAKQRMIETKGAILSLLQDAYQKRDRVGMVAFKGDHAEVLLPPTNSVEMAQKCLVELPVGGKTPLAAGLVKAQKVIRQHLQRSPHMRPIVVILSDGKANVAMADGKPLAEAHRVAENMREEFDIKYIVVDTEQKGLLSFGKAQELAVRLGAEYCTIDQLKVDGLVDIVRGALA